MTDRQFPLTAPQRPAMRLAWLDLARGLAVAMMIVYHLSWDLSFNGLADLDVTGALGWRLFARIIAGSFLFLAGYSFTLTHGGGFRRDAFLRRFLLLAAAAAIVSLGTWYAFPDSYVFFGILHCMAFGSLIAIPFLRAPLWLTAALAAAAFSAPYFLSTAAFDAPYLAWIGLRTTPPHTNDYVPILPWIAPLLAGLLTGRLRPGESIPAAAFFASRLLSPLRFAGRHSLLIYLLHQPLLFGATALLGNWSGTTPVADDAAPFRRACETVCVAGKTARETCSEICFCTADGLKAIGVWPQVVAGSNDTKILQEISRISAICRN